jgi:23S rRNA (cytidine1920-2'-O)/16S rRNA (cytidine1409-2'-O)-methyltransferase
MERPKGPQSLSRAVARLFPDLSDPRAAIVEGQITVDGRVIRNPNSVVGPGSQIGQVQPSTLRGEAKLRAALEAFRVAVHGRIALDVGAAAGGFTRTLLDRGAARVYAVDAGHGQLLGSLRQDERVRNLEATNLADLNGVLVPDSIDLFTLDLSYLSLADAVPQLERVRIAEDADLIALVKPMFELRLPQPPEDEERLHAALRRAQEGVNAGAWHVIASIESPVRGGRGAFEFLLHARRRAGV